MRQGLDQRECNYTSTTAACYACDTVGAIYFGYFKSNRWRIIIIEKVALRLNEEDIAVCGLDKRCLAFGGGSVRILNQICDSCRAAGMRICNLIAYL